MKKILNFCIVGLALLFSVKTEAQTIVTVTMTDTSKQVFTVSVNGKLYFDNDQLIVIESFAQTAAIDLADIQKVQFRALDDDGITPIAKENLTIYPNPTTGMITISGLDGHSVDVSLYSANGQLIMKKKISSDEQIDLGTLKRGLYLLKINDSVYKISKI